MAGLARVLNHPELSDRPFILETPQDDPGDDTRNLIAARELIADLSGRLAPEKLLP